MAVLGLHYYKGLSLTGSEQALLLITVHSLLLFWSSGFRGLGFQQLQFPGSRAQAQ